MRKSILFALFILGLAVNAAFAQNTIVTGTVRDGQGSPVPAATISLKDASSPVYTVSDADGKYEITVPANGVLEIACFGYETQLALVDGQKVVNVTLNEATHQLDETIVVAYGTASKSSFTGSAKQLSGDSIKELSSTNISNSLEGTVTGLQTASSTGTPGSSSSIIIRGIGSISASINPLIVVDGVPYEGSLNSISSQDIESITVLKDAAANSLYGARGSNGVIMVTTKRGDIGKLHITFEAKVGGNSRAIPTYDIVDNPGEYYEMTWESVRNSIYYGAGKPLAVANSIASETLVSENLRYNVFKDIPDNQLIDPLTGKLNPDAQALKWADNWNRDIFRSGIRQEYNFSASGGTEKTRAYMSASYLKDDGYVPQSGFSRISVRAKVDQEFTKWLSAGVNISYANTNQQLFGAEGSAYQNIFLFSQSIAPIYPIFAYDLATGDRLYGPKGEVLYDWGEARPFGTNSNPYGQLLTSERKTTRDNVSTRGYIDIKFMKDLKFTANVAFDLFNTKTNIYYTPAGGDGKNVNGRGTQGSSRYAALNANQLLTYTPSFGEHNLNIMIGHEIKKDNSYGLESQKTNFVDISVSDFDNALSMEYISSAKAEYFLQGYFARAEYNYAERYIVSASFRRDGSSRFAPDKRWGNFWSVGASWNAKQEQFLKNVEEVNALRIKASYGTQGNDNIGYTKVYEDLYEITPVQDDQGNYSASLTKKFRAAPEVTWEKSKTLNVGLETRFFDRLSLNVEFFRKNIDDMIYLRPLAPSQGLPASQLVNDMSMMNQGVEFEISADIFNNRNFSWNVFINGTHYKNSITKLPSDKPQEGYATGSYWREVGRSIYEFYTYDYLGVDPANGLPQYYAEKVNDDETKTSYIVNTTVDATRVKTGKTSIPDLYGGFGTSLKFYGVDISASFAYQLGGWTMDSNYQSLMSAGDVGRNWHKDIFNRWTPENTITDVPRVENATQQANASSTRFLTKASYLSLKNLTVGYTFPKHLTKKIKVQNLRLYVVGDNLWYTSCRKGLDVRQNYKGEISFSYAALRTISGGVSFTF